MSGQQLGKPGAGDNKMNERPRTRHGSHGSPSGYHPDEKQAQAGAKRILFCETLEPHSFLRGPGLQARVTVLGRRGVCLYPGNCCCDPTIC